MLDLHIIHTIRNATKYYRENESAFNALFPDIGASLRTKYFNAFQQDISFDKGYLTKIEIRFKKSINAHPEAAELRVA